MRYQRNVIIALALMIVLFIIGVIGYWFIEKGNPHERWTLLDAIYMTVITLTTVGYGDYNMSDAGKLFTVALLIVGIGVFAYSVSVATAFIVEGQLQEIYRRRKMERLIEKLSNHYIICGTGDTGVHALDEMIQMNVNLVVIEREEERINHLLETRDFLYVLGDATEDEVLIRAGVERARGLITSLSTDQDNLFVVLSAKQLNPNLRVVSKAVEDTSLVKLQKAGADEVVLPDQSGGIRLAAGVTRPIVVAFLDIMLKSQVTTRFAESVIQSGSDLVGQTLSQAHIPDRTGLVLVAVHDRQGKFIYNPSGRLILNVGDALIVIADNEQLQRLNKLTGDML
ncbi:MAG: NAD-binding protein [Candidatus Poribacteria bacterium]|nr:NAD-binding protein [Candidatus Poribacteria bacterium]